MVSVIAFFIIKQDLVYYSQADSRLLYIERRLGVVLEEDYLDERLQRATSDDFSVSDDVATQTPIPVKAILQPRIRALILSIFIAYTILGISEVVYFAVLFFS